jgi:hypothetical protein
MSKTAKSDELQALRIGDPIGDAFANHYGRQVGIGSNTIRHDWRISDSQPLDSVDFAALVHNRHLVILCTHLACSG